MAEGYTQAFGARKAKKYRKYALDLIEDYGRADKNDATLRNSLYELATHLNLIADHCEPPPPDDPYDGL